MLFGEAADEMLLAGPRAVPGVLTRCGYPYVFTDLDPRPRTARTATAALEHHSRSIRPRHVVTTTAGQLSGFEASANVWQWVALSCANQQCSAWMSHCQTWMLSCVYLPVQRFLRCKGVWV